MNAWLHFLFDHKRGVGRGGRCGRLCTDLYWRTVQFNVPTALVQWKRTPYKPLYAWKLAQETCTNRPRFYKRKFLARSWKLWRRFPSQRLVQRSPIYHFHESLSLSWKSFSFMKVFHESVQKVFHLMKVFHESLSLSWMCFMKVFHESRSCFCKRLSLALSCFTCQCDRALYSLKAGP